MTKNELLEFQLMALAIFDARNTTMSVSECAEFLGCHEQTVRRGLKSGKIIGSFVAGWRIPKLQFHKEIIDAYLNDQEKVEKVRWEAHRALNQ